MEMDQTCGVQGRQITWNLLLHRDVLTYVKERNIAAICVSLDQQKAFDRVDHTFLWKVTEGLGLGGTFTKWIKVSYTGINSKIKINGHLTDKVQQTRGLLQGCPLSVVLFVLYAEPLACAIRGSHVVKGVTLSRGESLKIS